MDLELSLKRLFCFLLLFLLPCGLHAITVHTNEGESLKFDELFVSSPYLVGNFYGQNLSLPLDGVASLDSDGDKVWVCLRSGEKVLAKDVLFSGNTVTVSLTTVEKLVELDIYSVESFSTKVEEVPTLSEAKQDTISSIKLDLQEHEKLTAIEQQISDRTVVGEVGQINTSINAAYYTSKDYSNATTTSQIVSVGGGVVLDAPVRLYAFGSANYEHTTMEISYNGDVYKVRNDGFTGATVGVRGVLLQETYSLPEISISPRYTFSLTSDSQLSMVNDMLGLDLSVVKTADPVVWFARISSRWREGEMADTPYRLGYEIGAAIAFNEQISLMGSVGFVNYPRDNDLDDSYSTISFGVNYRVTDHIYLDNSIQLELDEVQPDLMFSLGVTYR